MKNTSNKPMSKSTAILTLILIAAGGIGLIFLANSPALQPMRDSIIFIIILRLAISAAVVYFIWFANEKPDLVGQVITSTVLFAMWLPLFISSNQTLLFIDTIILYFIIGYILYLFFTSKKILTVVYMSSLLLGLGVFMSMEDYGFINNPDGIHFWQISLILAVFVGLIFAAALKFGNIELSDNRKSERILFPILTFGITFALVWSTACNLNYALDSSQPEEYIAVIEDMEIDSGRRRPTLYKFTLDINGKSVELNVSQSEYHSYDVGDKFPVKLYQGAFDDPYYISGNI